MVNCAKRPKRAARLPNEERHGMEDKEEGVFFRMNRLSLLSFIDNNCNYLLKKRENVTSMNEHVIFRMIYRIARIIFGIYEERPF